MCSVFEPASKVLLLPYAADNKQLINKSNGIKIQKKKKIQWMKEKSNIYRKPIGFPDPMQFTPVKRTNKNNAFWSR